MLLDEIVGFRQDEIVTMAKKREREMNPDMAEESEEEQNENQILRNPNNDHGQDEELGELELKEFIRQWEKEFEKVNSNPEENSDFDSDNEINPLDSIDNLGHYFSSSRNKQQISSENLMKRKPIQISIVGKPNTGKSTLVNSLLQESRVIANDLPGTTRDAVRVQWIYAGRRVTLVDTAGIKMGAVRNESKVEEMMREQAKDSIKYSHVVGVMIDSMDAFTAADM
jgi:predicted GTPase